MSTAFRPGKCQALKRFLRCRIISATGGHLFSRESGMDEIRAQFEELDYRERYRAYSSPGKKSAAESWTIFEVLAYGNLFQLSVGRRRSADRARQTHCPRLRVPRGRCLPVLPAAQMPHSARWEYIMITSRLFSLGKNGLTYDSFTFILNSVQHDSSDRNVRRTVIKDATRA